MLTTILAILGLFALRLGVPLAVTILVCAALHRLDGQWSGSYGAAS